MKKKIDMVSPSLELSGYKPLKAKQIKILISDSVVKKTMHYVEGNT